MTKPNVTPTRQYLCEVFDYDEWTGEFTWKRPTSSRVSIGSPVGTINKHGYVAVKLNGGRYLAHRLIYKMMIDIKMLANKTQQRIHDRNRIVKSLEDQRQLKYGMCAEERQTPVK